MHIGEEVGNYKLDSPIGRGAFSEVYIAIHKPTDQRVAVKVIDLDKIPEEDNVCLARELVTILQMDHPNIMFTYEFIKEESYLYVFSEYLSGGTILNKINDRHGLDEAVAREYFLDILSAVFYLHKCRCIVHRDIKPQNIIISKRDKCKLIDFGFCNSGSDLSRFNSFVGTPGYTAPEIIKSDEYHNTCDIFSMGICLYAMVTGKTPIDLQNTNVALAIEQLANIQYPDTMSPLLVDLLQNMLQPNPSMRIPIDAIIRHPWIRTGCVPAERFEVHKLPIDLRYTTCLDDISVAHRRPLLTWNKRALASLGKLGFDTKKIANELRRGIVSSNTAAYFILATNLSVSLTDSSPHGFGLRRQPDSNYKGLPDLQCSATRVNRVQARPGVSVPSKGPTARMVMGKPQQTYPKTYRLSF